VELNLRHVTTALCGVLQFSAALCRRPAGAPSHLGADGCPTSLHSAPARKAEGRGKARALESCK